MTIGELEYYIYSETLVQIVDFEGNELARYDGRNSLEEMANEKIDCMWAGFDNDLQKPMLVISIL